MPDFVIKELWGIVPTMIYFAIAVIMFLLALWVSNKLVPFSLRKEIEDDQNIALGIIIGSGIIAMAIILSAALH